MTRERTAPADQSSSPLGAGDFSLLLGGPLYQLLLRLRMVRPPLQLLRRRLVLIPALAWMPLLLLTLVAGTFGGGVEVPFALDIETHTRFLLALPLMLVAEVLVHQRLRETVQQFVNRHVVPLGSQAAFDAAIGSALRLRNSMWVEASLLLIAFVIVPRAWDSGLALPVTTWYAEPTDAGFKTSTAGAWLVHLSLPLFQFLLLRWYFRLFVWWRFLWRVSRLPLQCQAAHPDRSGGLGFLGEGTVAFAPLLCAQSAVVSAFIADRVVHVGSAARDFLPEMVLIVFGLVAAVALPLLFFTPLLLRERTTALHRYGDLASRYVRLFEARWLQSRVIHEDALLGTPDVQSLADLDGSFDVVRQMRPFPVSPRALTQLAAIAALPFVPLVFTELSFRDLLNRAFGMLL